MKKIMLFLLTAMAFVACSTAMYNADGTKMTKQEIKAARAQHVHEGIENRDLHLSTLYSLEVKGDTIVSYLPYFGRAYSVPYGGGKALNFTGIMSYYDFRQGRKDQTLIEIGVENDEDTYVYSLSIFDNGNTSIDVRSRNREQIAFSGEME